ncbi:hypothetical protein Dimus_031342 [Dionaea muscipula]
MVARGRRWSSLPVAAAQCACVVGVSREDKRRAMVMVLCRLGGALRTVSRLEKERNEGEDWKAGGRCPSRSVADPVGRDGDAWRQASWFSSRDDGRGESSSCDAMTEMARR